MPDGKPGDSIHHDIVHLKLPIFGPACDDLVREVSARIPLSHLGELQKLIEPWPWNPEGTPRDLDLPEQRLRDLLERTKTLPPDPPPPPMEEPIPRSAPPEPPARRRRAAPARRARLCARRGADGAALRRLWRRAAGASRRAAPCPGPARAPGNA